MLRVVRNRWRELVLEGLAVLLGVLIAFSVESYGQDRSERAAERAYLAALAEELAVNRELLASQIDQSRARIEEVDGFLTRVVHEPSPEGGVESAVNEVLARVGPFRVVAYQSGALDDLLTSGGIELVESDVVRRAVLEYSRLLAQETLRQAAALQYWEDQMAPYYYENASLFDFMTWRAFEGESIPGALNVDAFHMSSRYSNLLIERSVRDGSLLSAREALAESLGSLSELLTYGAL